MQGYCLMDINQKITSVSDFLGAIDELSSSYTVSGILDTPTGGKFLYRGHSSTDYTLLPAVFRKTKDIDITTNNYVTNDRYLAYATEKEILQNFIAEACAYISKDPSTNFMKWAEYAQHYGAPTRFLDWTENPLVALYFACKDNKPTYKEQGREIGGNDGCVWMLHLSNYRQLAKQTKNTIFSDAKKKNCTIAEAVEAIYRGRTPEAVFKYPLVYKPYYVDARMSAQSSLFMVWGSDNKPLDIVLSEAMHTLHSNQISQGLRISSTSQGDEVFFKFQILKGSKQKILRELDHCGINEKTLFPGVDGIGRYIEMKYRFDLEEAKNCI